jgi:hypothetical protein
MTRPALVELERCCQKPDHRRIGNWMARRLARPLALRITWMILPLGISAHAATLVCWLVGLCAVAALAGGSAGGWLAGAVLLQLWYVLDHVDGQLARYQGTASLDGVQLDYLMHHSLNLLVPIGAGSGLAIELCDPLWALCGLAWGSGLLFIGLLHDARYKAFIQRLKRVQGELVLIGGGGARPSAQSSIPWRVVPLAAWLARKVCEVHVIINLLLLWACGRMLFPRWNAVLGGGFLLLLGGISCGLAAALIARSLRRQSAEQEFALWFHVPEGHELVFRDGWWLVEPQSLHGESPAVR